MKHIRLKVVAFVFVVPLVGGAMLWLWSESPYREGPLLRAVKRGDVAAVKALARDGSYVDRRCDVFFLEHFSGWTPLMWASFRRNPEVIAALVAAKADVDIADKFGRTALHLVVESTEIAPAAPCIAILVQGGASVDRLDRTGNAALHNAVTRGDVSATRRLLECGADVNRFNSDQMTPLALALSGESSAAIAKVLLENGANVRINAPNGRTMLDLAEMRGATSEIQDMLRSVYLR